MSFGASCGDDLAGQIGIEVMPSSCIRDTDTIMSAIRERLLSVRLSGHFCGQPRGYERDETLSFFDS